MSMAFRVLMMLACADAGWETQIPLAISLKANEEANFAY